MGNCWCKAKRPNRRRRDDPATNDNMEGAQEKGTDNNLVDELVLEMLKLIATFVDHGEEVFAPMVKLHMIADQEAGWLQVVNSLIHVIPLDDPLGPSAITIVFDDCPLPSKLTVNKSLSLQLTEHLQLSRARAHACTSSRKEVRVERNICVVLGCIADKFAGPNSKEVLTKDMLEYMLAFLETRSEPSVALFALLALEKFAQTTENKLMIKEKLAAADENPLLVLETLAVSNHPRWRQVGFCANWALDNVFLVEGRKLSYETTDMSRINAILNSRDVSEYLKISSNGLEARCDSYSFESVRCTHQIDGGCWYYECEIITPGVMQIGWATKNSHFLNHEGYGIGDDVYSISYDGCRNLIWHKAKATPVLNFPAWKAGDTLGCLIDLDKMEVVFSLNGVCLQPFKQIFEVTKFGFFAGASFMAFQQCRFNFGTEPFRHSPPSYKIKTFNEFGDLKPEEKKVIPRRLFLQQLKEAPPKENACTLCCDETATCILEPCMHSGFCSVCTSLLDECPMCRAPIEAVRREADDLA